MYSCDGKTFPEFSALLIQSLMSHDRKLFLNVTLEHKTSHK